MQVFFDLNETEKVPDEQVYNYFRLWIHHCVRIKDSVENQQPQHSQNLDVRNPGHGGQLNSGQSTTVQPIPQNQNFSMTARAMVNGQAPVNIPIGRLYPNENQSRYAGQFVNNTGAGSAGHNAPSMVQRFPTPVKNISPVKIGNQKIGTISKKRPSEEESDQEAKIIKHEVQETIPTTPPTQTISIEPPTHNIESRNDQPESKSSQQGPSYSLSQENMKALSMSASNQIRRGPIQSEVTNIPHSLPPFQNPSQANLRRALSQISNPTEQFQPLNSAHRRGIGFENRISLQDKITLLQSTNNILTSGNYFHNFSLSQLKILFIPNQDSTLVRHSFYE